MEETISTTSEVSTEQTTPDVVDTETTQPVETEQTTEETTTQEPETVAETETETEQPAKNWEQIAKDNQASFTRVSQELAELKKQIAQTQPKYVDDKGKITPEYEQQYRFNLDNREYLTYDQLSRQLEPDTRAEVERLLQEAKSLYNPNNKHAYNQKMSEIKNYFNADIVEQIALDKRQYESQMQSEFDRLTQEHRLQKSREFASLVEQSDDLKALLYQESENYSPEVFGIAKQMLELTGGIDFDVLNKAVSSVKALGVKEYLAQQKANAEKQKANVPTGQAVNAGGEPLTAEYVRQNYVKLYKAGHTQEELDRIIMKG